MHDDEKTEEEILAEYRASYEPYEPPYCQNDDVCFVEEREALRQRSIDAKNRKGMTMDNVEKAIRNFFDSNPNVERQAKLMPSETLRELGNVVNFVKNEMGAYNWSQSSPQPIYRIQFADAVANVLGID